MKDLEEVMGEFLARLPQIGEINLFNGRKGKFRKLVDSRRNEETGKLYAIFDFIFEDEGSPDHFEFTINCTGGGGFVIEKKHDISIASGELPKGFDKGCWKCGTSENLSDNVLLSIPPQFICKKCNGEDK